MFFSSKTSAYSAYSRGTEVGTLDCVMELTCAAGELRAISTAALSSMTSITVKASSWSWGWICLVGRITGRRRRQRRGDGDDVDAKFDDVEAGGVGGQESVPSSVTNAGRAFFVLDEHESCPCAAGRGF